jgi:predicted O-methyltransferase YrrM
MTPKRVLEIGTGNGEATLQLAKTLPPAGLLITMEQDASLAAEARRRFSEAGFADRISVIVGEPARFLHKIRGPFDLIVQRRGDHALRARLQALLAPDGVLIDGDTKYSE